jgi:hypothetical protein
MHPPTRSTRTFSTFGALALAALLALSAGCAHRPDVRHDQDPSADLRSYKTFAFYEHASSEPSSYAALLGQRLQQATRAELERQHYVYSERSPDLRVALRLVVQNKQELRSAPGTRGLHGYRGWASNDLETVDYRQGSLVIDLVDTRRNALVWHGVAEGRLDAKAIEQPGPAIDAAVGEVFKRFASADARSR